MTAEYGPDKIAAFLRVSLQQGRDLRQALDDTAYVFGVEHRAARVWLEGDEVPEETWFLTDEGSVEQDCTARTVDPGWSGPLVEVFVPDEAGYDAAVAAERERRAAQIAGEPSGDPPPPSPVPEPPESRSDDLGRHGGALAGELNQPASPEAAQEAPDAVEAGVRQSETGEGCEAATDRTAPPDDPGARLRRAADKLDRRAAAATQGRWQPEYAYGNSARVQGVFVECAAGEDGDDYGCDHVDCIDGTHGIGGFDASADNEWSILMGPQVAAPLVAWLRHPASRFDEDALAVAAVILGEAGLGEAAR